MFAFRKQSAFRYFGKFVAVGALGGVIIATNNSRRFVRQSHSESTPKPEGDVEVPSSVTETPALFSSLDEVEEEDDETWEENKSGCSFCAQFIASPCKAPFRTWSKCVDRAKKVEGVDFITLCKDHTKALMECVNENEDFFRREDAGEEGDDNVTGSTEDESEFNEDEAETKAESDGDEVVISHAATATTITATGASITTTTTSSVSSPTATSTASTSSVTTNNTKSVEHGAVNKSNKQL